MFVYKRVVVENSAKTKPTYLTSIQSDQRLFLCHKVVFFPSDRKKKQVSKPVPSIKQQLPLASEACGRQHEAFEQYLWLNGGCRAAPQAPSSSLYSFRVPLQSADPLWCGSTRTDLDSNHCPLIILTCLIVAPRKQQAGSCATKSRPLQNACFSYWM